MSCPGVHLDTIEPQLSHDPRVLLALITALRAANIANRVNLVAGFSPFEVEKLANEKKRRSAMLIIIIFIILS